VPQYTALSVLRNRAGLSNAQLARRCLVTPQAMLEVTARLEQAGLIRRDVAQNHKRILRARLTPRGARLFEALDAEIAEFEEQMLAGVSDLARKHFAETAIRCVHRLGAGLAEADRVTR